MNLSSAPPPNEPMIGPECGLKCENVLMFYSKRTIQSQSAFVPFRKGSSGEAGREVELEDLHEDEPPSSDDHS